MNITFLVGNGFDLSLGYKTSYEDFYKWYLDQPADHAYKDFITQLKNDIKKDIESGSKNWADFEIGLGKFTKSSGFGKAEEFMEAYNDAVQKLNEYLSQLPSNNQIDTISESQWNSIRQKFCCFYSEANKEDVFQFSNIKKAQESNNFEAIFHVISFNYTSFLDEYIKKIAQKPLEIWKHGSEERKHSLNPEVLHIHGSLFNDPIIGLSNEEQVSNPDFRKDISLRTCLIKSNAISEIGERCYSTAQELIKKSDIICLWGMSLGDSDKHWWMTINDWLRSNPNRHLFIFWHTTSPSQDVGSFEKFKKKRMVTTKLLKHSNISGNEFENLQSRIHVIYNTKKVLIFPTTINSHELG